MSDRTAFRMVVVSDGPDVRRRARALYEAEFDTADIEDSETGNMLSLASTEITCGSSRVFAETLLSLIEKVGEFGFLLAEDPAYEWLGLIYIHVPGLSPDYEGDADAEGQAVMTAPNIADAIEEARAKGLDLAEHLRLAAGITHGQALDALRKGA